MLTKKQPVKKFECLSEFTAEKKEDSTISSCAGRNLGEKAEKLNKISNTFRFFNFEHNARTCIIAMKLTHWCKSLQIQWSLKARTELFDSLD